MAAPALWYQGKPLATLDSSGEKCKLLLEKTQLQQTEGVNSPLKNESKEMFAASGSSCCLKPMRATGGKGSARKQGEGSVLP